MSLTYKIEPGGSGNGSRQKRSAYKKEWERKQSKIIGSRFRANRRYYAMVQRCATLQRYAHVKVLVSREEFISWFMPKDFSGSSVDRIDSDGHYELSNMRVIPLSDNCARVKARKGQVKFNPAGPNECRVCHVVKAPDDFIRKKGASHGRERECKTCNTKKTVAYKQRKRAEKKSNVTSI